MEVLEGVAVEDGGGEICGVGSASKSKNCDEKGNQGDGRKIIHALTLNPFPNLLPTQERQ